MAPLLAGIARANITPPVGMLMAGYAVRKTPAVGIHDELGCVVVYLASGDTEAALVTADLLDADQNGARRIREACDEVTGVPAGACGGVNGGANLHPRLYVELYEAAASGDLARTKTLQDQVLRITQTIYRVGRDGATVVKGLKCALSCLGLCDDFMAEPFHRLDRSQRREIERHLHELAIPRPTVDVSSLTAAKTPRG